MFIHHRSSTANATPPEKWLGLEDDPASLSGFFQATFQGRFFVKLPGGYGEFNQVFFYDVSLPPMFFIDKCFGKKTWRISMIPKHSTNKNLFNQRKHQ